MTFDEALAEKKLRVSWRCSRPVELPPGAEARTFALVCGKQPARPGGSQDELLEFAEAARDGDGWRLSVGYVFDHDFASQYDKTERWQLVAWLGGDGRDALERWDREG